MSDEVKPTAEDEAEAMKRPLRELVTAALDAGLLTVREIVEYAVRESGGSANPQITADVARVALAARGENPDE